MQSDRPLASYRCGLYANSFLRDDQERNHTRLWKVDLVDGLPGLLDDRPLFERRGPKARFKKAKKLSAEGPPAAGSGDVRWIASVPSSRPKARKVVALARSSCRLNDSAERTSPNCAPVEARRR